MTYSPKRVVHRAKATHSVRAGATTLIGALLGSSLAAQAMAVDMSFTGTAKSLSDTVLYEERHEVVGSCQDGVFRPQEHQIRYHRPDQANAFAAKDLTYPNSVIRPTVAFEQPDFSESLVIAYPTSDALTIDWQPPEGEKKAFEVAYSEEVVVDGGFDTLVRRHWDTMTSGGSVEFRFLAPTRGKHYAFVLEPVQNDRVEAEYTFQIRPTGMVLRFLVDPIILGYNGNGALTDYFGLTNIRKDLDTNHTAHIRYSVTKYPDCELTP